MASGTNTEKSVSTATNAGKATYAEQATTTIKTDVETTLKQMQAVKQCAEARKAANPNQYDAYYSMVTNHAKSDLVIIQLIEKTIANKKPINDFQKREYAKVKARWNDYARKLEPNCVEKYLSAKNQKDKLKSTREQALKLVTTYIERVGAIRNQVDNTSILKEATKYHNYLEQVKIELNRSSSITILTNGEIEYQVPGRRSKTTTFGRMQNQLNRWELYLKSR